MTDREQASAIEDAASGWAAKAERGLTAGERADLDHWLEGDSRRLGAFVRVQAAWVHAERAKALGRMPEPDDAPVPAAPANEAPRSPAVGRRSVLGGGAALAASLAVAYTVAADRYDTLESGVGEMRHIALAGGASLTLDTDTRVDVLRSASASKLELVRGKIFLDVMRSQESPLTVRARNLVLEVAKGVFSLERLAKTPLVALVTEGSLTVAQSRMFAPQRTITLEKDHVLTLSSDEDLLASDVRPVAAARREQLLAWRDGMLSFSGEPLANAVRAFDRYGPARIVVVDPDLARQKIVGLFKADDPRGFAAAVAASFGGVVTSQGQIVRISARKSYSA